MTLLLVGFDCCSRQACLDCAPCLHVIGRLTVHCPCCVQLELFSNALQTGQLDLNSFGLRAAGFTVADFLQAIQDQVDLEKKPTGTNG